MNRPKLQVVSILSMPFAENSYLVFRQGSPEAIIIDPGLEPELILKEVRKHKLKIVAILNTHGHADHIAGNEAMKEAFPDAPLLIGTGDALMLTDASLNLSAPFGMPIVSPPADQLLNEGDTINHAGIKLKIRDIPGHSPGHIVFIAEDETPVKVFGGDTLFAGSIGRTDFPGGSLEVLLDGIRKKLFKLPDETIVYPGHNEPTTVGVEKRQNPYLS
ncbi:MAG TPA: MBL fold metallo-hydrolase [Gemmatales bacterium]|nr:MBL fold metallo-hydrolase [Gemmatales bacterium]